LASIARLLARALASFARFSCPSLLQSASERSGRLAGACAQRTVSDVAGLVRSCFTTDL
jgi:hypothetical protein